VKKWCGWSCDTRSPSQPFSKEKKFPPAKVNQPQNGTKNTQKIIENAFHFSFSLCRG